MTQTIHNEEDHTMSLNELFWESEGERVPVVHIWRIMATAYGSAVKNIHGGASGTTHDSGTPLHRVWKSAVHTAPTGTRYRLVIQSKLGGRDQERGVFTRGAEPWTL